MSPEITITSEELRERVEDHLDRWIPDDVWNRAEPYARHKNDCLLYTSDAADE